MSWFERLLPLLDGLPTERLALMRDIINAMVERRRLVAMASAPTHENLESALLSVCDLAGSRPSAINCG